MKLNLDGVDQGKKEADDKSLAIEKAEGKGLFAAISGSLSARGT